MCSLRLFNYIKNAVLSDLAATTRCSAISPMWEVKQNRSGGKWSYDSNTRRRTKDLDDLFFDLVSYGFWFALLFTKLYLGLGEKWLKSNEGFVWMCRAWWWSEGRRWRIRRLQCSTDDGIRATGWVIIGVCFDKIVSVRKVVDNWMCIFFSQGCFSPEGVFHPRAFFSQGIFQTMVFFSQGISSAKRFFQSRDFFFSAKGFFPAKGFF